MDAYVESQDENGNNVQELLVPYSEEERQEVMINKANAAAVFRPQFIPVDPELLQVLTPYEAIILGFIRFFTANAERRFYFTNDQIAEMLNCSNDTITKAVKKLKELDLISVSRSVRSGGGQIRFIRPDLEKSRLRKFLSCNSENSLVATQKKPVSNKNKIKEKDIDKSISQKKRFQKPTIEEITEYCLERKNNVDPQRFYDHYESNGWKVGRNAMKNWRAAVRTWERSDYGGNSTPPPSNRFKTLN